ncbi:MAG TPA: sulfite exporter TauE/SafE family protein [Patescibacteria group bacterium]|nr:sulfite exporter TauE/SafE family protein [Patescibacteria group bacterium]
MLVVLIGFFAGIIGGMGIGGGTILIPSLIFFLGTKQHTAQSVNLISFIPTAFVAILIHLRHKSVEKRLVLKLILLGVIGAALGSFIAVSLNAQLLKKVFAGFLFIMGLYEIFSKKNIKKKRG